MGDVSAATTTHPVVFFIILVYTMKNNYSVYQHVTPDGMYYFGATSNVERRWSNNGAEYKRTALQPYIEKFGWDNIQHIVLFENQTKENALWTENFLIETAREDGVCINKNRSGLISKEEGYDKKQSKQYYETNKGQVQERHKQYYETNRDEMLEQSRQYYQKNREKKLEQSRQYYQKNREKELEWRRQYYQKNREKELEQKRQRYQKNREKELEQSRQRYQRKKLEKQFRELGYVPLF